MKKELKDLSLDEQKEYSLSESIRLNSWINVIFLVAICMILLKNNIMLVIWLVFSTTLWIIDMYKFKKLYGLN